MAEPDAVSSAHHMPPQVWRSPFPGSATFRAAADQGDRLMLIVQLPELMRVHDRRRGVCVPLSTFISARVDHLSADHDRVATAVPASSSRNQAHPQAWSDDLSTSTTCYACQRAPGSWCSRRRRRAVRSHRRAGRACPAQVAQSAPVLAGLDAYMCSTSAHTALSPDLPDLLRQCRSCRSQGAVGFRGSLFSAAHLRGSDARCQHRRLTAETLRARSERCLYGEVRWPGGAFAAAPGADPGADPAQRRSEGSLLCGLTIEASPSPGRPARSPTNRRPADPPARRGHLQGDLPHL